MTSDITPSEANKATPMHPLRPPGADAVPRHPGGRPPHEHLKAILHTLMQQLQVADVHRVQQAYTQQTGRRANYHTIKKYLDRLVQDDILRCEIISDNEALVKAGKRTQRRRLVLYRLN